MLTAETEILDLDADCVALLQAYRRAAKAKRAERALLRAEQEASQASAAAPDPQPDGSAVPATEAAADETGEATPPPAGSAPTDGFDNGEPWSPRIGQLDGVDAERLSGIHGRLIAAGHLVFQIRNRKSGMEYRVSNSGKQFLAREAEQAAATDDEDHEQEAA